MEDVSTKRLYSQDNDIPLQIFVWLFEILFQSTKQMLYEWTLKCAVSLENHLKAVTEAFHPLRTHQHYWTSERWTSQKWSKGRNASVTVLRWFVSDTAHFCVTSYNICGKANTHLCGKAQNFQKPFKGYLRLSPQVVC